MFKKLKYFSTKKFQNFKSGHTYMKDVECAETNQKSIFRFLRFYFWDMNVFVLKNGLFSINFEQRIDHSSLACCDKLVSEFSRTQNKQKNTPRISRLSIPQNWNLRVQIQVWTKSKQNSIFVDIFGRRIYLVPET